ncbi:MAG: fibronectin type III domain-containing protein, partial [Spirochaetota bacterium]
MNRLSKSMMISALIAAVLVFAACQNLLQTDDDDKGWDADTTPADTTPPGEVSSLTASAGDGEVALSWSDPPDGDLDHIEITWSPGDGESRPKPVAAGAQETDITGLTNGTPYTFTVKTVDTSGNTSAGETASAMPAAPGDTTPPGEVSSLTAIAGDAAVELSWSDPPDGDLG